MTEKEKPDDIESLIQQSCNVPGPDENFVHSLADRTRQELESGLRGQLKTGPIWRRLAWPCATAASTLVTLALGAFLIFRPAPQGQIIERVVIVREPAPSIPSPSPVPDQEKTERSLSPPLDRDLSLEAAPPYIQLREKVLQEGLKAFPDLPPWTAAQPPEPLENFLDLPADVLREPWFRQREKSLSSGDAS